MFCFLPWYGLANVLLVLGAVKEIRALLLVWLAATVISLVWNFVLLSILFSYDTTVGLVLTFAVLHLVNFIVVSYFMLVVFSFYQVNLKYHGFKIYLPGIDGHENQGHHHRPSGGVYT